MKNLYVRTVKPKNLSNKEKQDLVTLHQQQINLDSETILNHLSLRDYVLLYYHKKDNRLLATIGVQTIHFKKEAILYFGNVVVDPSCVHEGCISHASSKYVLQLFLKNPFKRKYCSGLASSSGSLVYSLKHRPCWPNPDQDTPIEVTELMINALEKIGVTEYKIEQGNLITTNLSNKINNSFHKCQRPISAAESFFNHINPGAEKGEQVFFLNPFTVKNSLDLTIHAMHGQLIKHPKFYHIINKNKENRPFYSFVVLILAIVKIKIW